VFDGVPVGAVAGGSKAYASSPAAAGGAPTVVPGSAVSTKATVTVASSGFGPFSTAEASGRSP